MTIVGNFIVGFDTDTRSVFRDTLDFIQETGILFPFFSILTPMPGTQLHEDYKDEGRLDHFDWHLYDTRHVVMEPKHMRRDELMDGYVWLFDQAYGPDLLLDRIERHWKGRQRRKTSWLERQLLKWRLRPELHHDDASVRELFRGGMKLLGNRHLSGDAGQLLFVLDGNDFARFMHRFRSPNWEQNYQTFANPETAESNEEEVQLRVRQWETKRAQRASERHKVKLTRLEA